MHALEIGQKSYEDFSLQPALFMYVLLHFLFKWKKIRPKSLWALAGNTRELLQFSKNCVVLSSEIMQDDFLWAPLFSEKELLPRLSSTCFTLPSIWSRRWGIPLFRVSTSLTNFCERPLNHSLTGLTILALSKMFILLALPMYTKFESSFQTSSMAQTPICWILNYYLAMLWQILKLYWKNREDNRKNDCTRVRILATDMNFDNKSLLPYFQKRDKYWLSDKWVTHCYCLAKTSL